MPRENFSDHLAHAHPGSMLDSFDATKEYSSMIAERSLQTHCYWTQGGRWRNNNDEIGIRAIAEFVCDLYRIGKLQSRDKVAVFTCLQHTLDPSHVVTPEGYLSPAFTP